MTDGQNPSPSNASAPIWKRALMRFAGVAVVLIIGVELLRLAGRAEHLDRVEELYLALAGGAVYAGLWALMAAMTANLLKKITTAAKGDEK